MKKILLFLFVLNLIYLPFFSQETRIKEKLRQAEEYRNKNLQKKWQPGAVQLGSYNVNSILYTPYPYTGAPVLNGIDDHWGASIPIGFDFCYFGITYNQIVIGSNGQITFDLTVANGFNGWSISTALPNTIDMPAKTICGSFRDSDPSISGNIYYNTFGTAPNRALVISWDSIALFSASCQSGNSLTSFQVALHEGSSVIDIYIANSTSCSAWNGGYGIIGIQDELGTTAVCPPNRNYPNTWTAINEAWQFVPTSGDCLTPCGDMNDTICFVNTNSNLQNEVFFNHLPATGGVEGTIVYRLNSMTQWDSIGFVPYNQPDVYTDLTANPAQQNYTYAVAHRDSCNNVGPKSIAHTTIFLQSSLGSGSSINLSWNAYVGLPVTSYYIYRGPNANSMTLIGQVPNTTLAYTDLNPPLGNNFYKVEIMAPANCTSNASHDTLVGSNYKTTLTTAVNNNNSLQTLRLYPNPAKGEVTISAGVQFDEIKVTDVLGAIVFESKQPENEVKITIQNPGVYFVTATTGKHSITRKLVVN